MRKIMYFLAAVLLMASLSGGLQAAPDGYAPGVPVLSIVAPMNGATISGDGVQIAVSINSDQARPVAKLRVFLDGQSITERVLDTPTTQGASSFAWKTSRTPNGGHQVDIQAFAANGDYLGMASCRVTVLNRPVDMAAPKVSVTSPKEGEVVSGTKQIVISASDNSGIDPLVAIYVDDSLRSASNTKPYVYDWDTTQQQNGPHIISVKATDDSDNEGRTKPIKVIVRNAGKQAPVEASATMETTVTEVAKVPASTPVASEDHVQTPESARTESDVDSTATGKFEVPQTATKTVKTPVAVPAPAAKPVQVAKPAPVPVVKPVAVSQKPAAAPAAVAAPVPAAKPVPVAKPASVAAVPAAKPVVAANPAPSRPVETPKVQTAPAPKPVVVAKATPAPVEKPVVASTPAAKPVVVAKAAPAPAPVVAPVAQAKPAPAPKVESASAAKPAPKVVVIAKADPVEVAPKAPVAKPVMEAKPAPVTVKPAPAPAAKPVPVVKPVTVAKAKPVQMAKVTPAPVVTEIAKPVSAPVVKVDASAKVKPVVAAKPVHAVRPVLKADARVDDTEVSAAEPAKVSAGTRYVVAMGDSFAKIAKAYGTSVRSIIALNDVDPMNLQVGQILEMPTAAKMIRIRSVVEDAGGKVVWNSKSRTVRAVCQDKSIKLKIGSTKAVVNSDVVRMERAAKVHAGRTVIPKSFVTNSLGIEVTD